jgi:hypothetical protein
MVETDGTQQKLWLRQGRSTGMPCKFGSLLERFLPRGQCAVTLDLANIEADTPPINVVVDFQMIGSYLSAVEPRTRAAATHVPGLSQN